MNQSNYYKIIGVNPSASEEEIQNTFKALFARYNPSSNPNSMYLKKMFQQLNEAYEVLGDKVRREAYNASMGFDIPRSTVKENRGSNVVPPSVTETSQSQGNILPPPDVTVTSEQTEKMVPLPQIERGEVRTESVVREKVRNNGTNENKAYVFLFILIGVILIGGGVFAYFEFGDTGEATEMEEVVEVDTVSPVKQDKEKDVNPIKIEAKDKGKGEINVSETTIKVTEDKVEEEVKKRDQPSKLAAPVINKKQNDLVKDDGEKRKVEDKKGVSPVMSKSNGVKDGLETKKAFKVGASKTEVWAVKGDPTDITSQGNIEIWHYGKTKIKFKDGKVVD